MSQVTPTEAATNAIACMLQDDELKKAMDAYIDGRIMMAFQLYTNRVSNNNNMNHPWDFQQELISCRTNLLQSYDMQQAVKQHIRNATA